MNNTAEGKAAVEVAALLFQFIWVFFLLWALKFGHDVLGKSYQSGMNLANKARRSGTNAAKNTRWGQAAQQFGSNRRAIAQLKGRETLRGIYQKNPGLSTALMGGPGGGKFASRFLDAEHRKHRAEQAAELTKGMTLPIAHKIAERENLNQALRMGQWADGKKLTDEDKVGIKKLSDQGYISPSGRVEAGTHQSSIVANAALESIYNADDVTPEAVANIGSLLQGTSPEENAEFSELNRNLAVKNKSKNVAFAQFDDGKLAQFRNKSPEGILASGLQGMNKDALKPQNLDYEDDGVTRTRNRLLSALHDVTHDESGNRDLRAVIERTEQTMDQSHQDVLQGLSDAMGFANVEEFKELRSALKSGGGVASLPAPYRQAMGGGGGGQPTPAPQPAPQLVVPHGPNTARTTGRVNFQGQVNTPPPPNPPNNPPNP